MKIIFMCFICMCVCFVVVAMLLGVNVYVLCYCHYHRTHSIRFTIKWSHTLDIYVNTGMNCIPRDAKIFSDKHIAQLFAFSSVFISMSVCVHFFRLPVNKVNW